MDACKSTSHTGRTLARFSGSRGLRKLRWAAKGHGKRGGVRVIYYWHVTPEIITLLDIYPKNEKDDLTKDEIRLLNLLLED